MILKKCSRCNTEKAVDLFSYRDKKKGTRQPYCKGCRKTMDATIWSSDASFRARKIKRQQEYRTRNARFVLEYLEKSCCVDCGESDPIVLEFDHRDDKVSGICELMDNASISSLEIEMAKCDVRCANCHRRKTAKDFGYFRWLNKST